LLGGWYQVLLGGRTMTKEQLLQRIIALAEVLVGDPDPAPHKGQWLKLRREMAIATQVPGDSEVRRHFDAVDRAINWFVLGHINQEKRAELSKVAASARAFYDTIR
jgi:hypothetical protein